MPSGHPVWEGEDLTSYRVGRRAAGGRVFTAGGALGAVIAKRIVAEAVRVSGGESGRWRVGTSGDPRRSRREHSSPRSWAEWDAGSSGAAAVVEGMLLEMGMARAPAGRRAGAGSGFEARHVYVFMA